MSKEHARELINPRCIERPGFLFFKHRRHEPGESLSLHASWGADTRFWPPIHARIGASVTGPGHVEHVVAVVCKHCDQGYFAEYNWREGGSISWRGLDELWPDALNRALEEAMENRRNVWETVQEGSNPDGR